MNGNADDGDPANDAAAQKAYPPALTARDAATGSASDTAAASGGDATIAQSTASVTLVGR